MLYEVITVTRNIIAELTGLKILIPKKHRRTASTIIPIDIAGAASLNCAPMPVASPSFINII